MDRKYGGENMATVHICDRCGAEIELYNKDKHYVQCLIDADFPDGRKYQSYDLCSKCQKILEFIMEDFIAECKSNYAILDFIGIDENGNNVENNC